MSRAKTTGATGATSTRTTSTGATGITTAKSEKEQAIIAAIKMLPKSAYGEYHYREELRMIIAKVMDYKICRFRGGTWTIAGFENPEKVKIIIEKMEAKESSNSARIETCSFTPGSEALPRHLVSKKQ